MFQCRHFKALFMYQAFISRIGISSWLRELHWEYLAQTDGEKDHAKYVAEHNKGDQQTKRAHLEWKTIQAIVAMRGRSKEGKE